VSRPAPDTLDSYKHFLKIPTRWADNDVYGHVNNSVYYFYFDTVVNEFLVAKDLLDIETFPDTINAGLRVSRLGTSSVIYDIGLFRNDETTTAAQGQFTHVYVDRETRRPVPMSEAMRDVLQSLTV